MILPDTNEERNIQVKIMLEKMLRDLYPPGDYAYSFMCVPIEDGKPAPNKRILFTSTRFDHLLWMCTSIINEYNSSPPLPTKN